jgi:CheY-like chemotaxis protein
VTLGSHSRILVVEDEWLIADQIVGALEACGYDVAGPVGRMAEALDLLADGRIDAALIDINVDGERTFALAQQLNRSAIPFAFVTGYSGADLPAEFNARRLIQKPIDATAVRSCVEGLLPYA